MDRIDRKVHKIYKLLNNSVHHMNLKDNFDKKRRWESIIENIRRYRDEIPPYWMTKK
jgi:hypothetical protein